MSLKQNKNFGSPEGFNSLKRERQTNTNKRVVEIILNSKHPMYKSQDDIGTIFFCDVQLKEVTTKPFSLPRAKPLNINNYTVPLIGEVVQVTEAFTPSPDLDSNPISTNYYQNCVNVHNNAGSNALPLDISKKKGNNKSKTEPDTTTFEFKKEFKTSGSQEVAAKMLNQYLLSLGFLGRSDPRAPKYILIQLANGDYVYRLEEDDDNNITQRLGNWFKEKKNQQNLNPTEGGTIIQGKSGQRINMLTAGPNGTNSISRNVTDVDGDGNPNIGDRALIISLGEGDTENVTFDACSIYLGENLSLPIDAASTNADSTKSTFEPIKDPLEQIETPPPAPIPQTNPEPSLQVQEISYDAPAATTPTAVKETTPIVATKDDFSDDEMDDPVFAALAEAQEEGNISFIDSETYEIAGTECPPEEQYNEIERGDESEESFNEAGEYEAPSASTDGTMTFMKNKNNYQAFIKGKSIKEMEKYYPITLKGGVGAAEGTIDIVLDPKSPSDMIERLRADGVNSSNCPSIKYLILHTTATPYRNQHELINYFYYKNRWKRHGYNISIDSDGRCNYNVDIVKKGNSNGCALNTYPAKINFPDGDSFGKLTNYNAINMSWIGTLEKARGGTPPVRNFPKIGRTTKPNITANQSYSFQSLIEYFCEAFPDIKIAGHNQITIKTGTGKSCPTWNNVRLLDLMKDEKDSNVKDKNIFRKFPSDITNDEFYSKIDGTDAGGSTYINKIEVEDPNDPSKTIKINDPDDVNDRDKTFRSVKKKAKERSDKRVLQNFTSYYNKTYTNTADYVFALTHPSKYL